MKPTVVILTTYPFFRPRHGGQLRVFNIRAAYLARGFTVETITVCAEETLAEAAEGDRCVAFRQDHPMRQWHGKAVPLITDLLTGPFAAQDAEAFARIVSLLPKKVDVFEIEQPWLLPLVVALKKRPAFADSLVVYNSQNVESELKRRILKDWSVREADTVADAIAALERNAAQISDITFAVSEQDAEEIRTWTNKPVIVAANGVNAWKASEDALEQWRARLGQAPFALFVGSAHPPNVTGFLACMGESFAYLSPTQRVVIAGGVGPSIADALRTTRWRTLNLSRIDVLGMVSDEDLSAIKDLAHTFLLPIGFGGGSNIKTAEAILSGKHVVATKVAFRGFDAYASLPGVRIVGKGGYAFADATVASLAEPLPQRTAAQRARADEVLWERTVAIVPSEVQARLARRSAPQKEAR